MVELTMTNLNRRRFLAASSVGLAAAMAGCAGDALSTDDGRSTGDDAQGSDRTITVSASGEVETDPDKATVSVGLESRGDAAEDVTDDLAARAEQLRGTFSDLEIPDENVEEGRYDVRPVSNREGSVEEFRGTHSFDITIDDVDRVGEVIDAAVEAGADDVGRVNFTLQDETRDELRKDAIDDALANADEEAEHVADNRGVELTGTTSVTTSDVDVQPVRYDAASEALEADDAGTARTEIDADPVSVTASATVVYSFAEN